MARVTSAEGAAALIQRLNEATEQIVADIAHLIQAGGMLHAPVGTPGNTTNMPGDLRRSIVVEGPERISDNSWGARVGPTVIYGRQRELGGDIFPVRAKFLRFHRFGLLILTRHVFQFPEPYMKPAEMQSRDAAYAIAIDRLSAAIEG